MLQFNRGVLGGLGLAGRAARAATIGGWSAES